MRKLSLNKFERIAGLFIVVAVAGVVLTGISAAIKQGWFEPKIKYTTVLSNADGIHQGTLVQISGLRAGSVETVEFEKDNQIRVSFYVMGKFQDRIREDSAVQLVRPFIIGERILDISLGTPQHSAVPAHGVIKSIDTMDLMSLMSGRNMSSTLSKLTGLIENMQILLEAFSDKSRAESIVHVIDRLDPLMRNLNTMSLEVVKLSKQATHDDNMQKLFSSLVKTTVELNHVLPELNKENPQLGRDLGAMTQNLAIMTKALGPAVKKVESDLPVVGVRLVEALNETVVILKAMQKNFLLKGSIQEVREEEAKRLPANQK